MNKQELQTFIDTLPEDSYISPVRLEDRDTSKILLDLRVVIPNTQTETNKSVKTTIDTWFS